MRPPRDGDFYINNSNQDFWLRENGVWVRKGNIRDEGTTGLVGIQPILGHGFDMSVAHLDRIRLLTPGAEAVGFNMTVTSVDRIRAISAAMSLGFNEAATVTTDVVIGIAASMGLGYVQSVGVTRERDLTDAVAFGYNQATTLTHGVPTLPGVIVIGLAVSPWTLWYDSTIANLTPSWTVPAAAIVAAEVSPDKSLLVIATGSALFRYDVTGATPVYLGALSSPPSWANIASISFSEDSTRLLVIDGQLSPNAWVYNTSTWTTVTAPSVGANATSADFGSGLVGVLVANPSTQIDLFDTPGMGASATQLGTQPTGFTWINIAVSPSGSYLAANGSATPSPFRIWQMSSRSAPLASPATMPHASAAQLGKAIRWNHAGTKLTVCDNFGSYCYRVSGTTITLDQTINFNVSAGAAPIYRSDDTKLYLAQRGVAPRFQVFSISGNVYTADTNPTVQPATDPSCIATTI